MHRGCDDAMTPLREAIVAQIALKVLKSPIADRESGTPPRSSLLFVAPRALRRISCRVLSGSPLRLLRAGIGFLGLPVVGLRARRRGVVLLRRRVTLLRRRMLGGRCVAAAMTVGRRRVGPPTIGRAAVGLSVLTVGSAPAGR